MAHTPYLKLYNPWNMAHNVHHSSHTSSHSIKNQTSSTYKYIYAQTHDKSDFNYVQSRFWEIAHFSIPWTNPMTGLGSNPIGQTIWPTHRMSRSWKTLKCTTKLTSANN